MQLFWRQNISRSNTPLKSPAGSATNRGSRLTLGNASTVDDFGFVPWGSCVALRLTTLSGVTVWWQFSSNQNLKSDCSKPHISWHILNENNASPFATCTCLPPCQISGPLTRFSSKFLDLLAMCSGIPPTLLHLGAERWTTALTPWQYKKRIEANK